MAVIQKLFFEGETISFKKGEILISPNKEPKGIYFIIEGFVYSYTRASSRKKRIQTIAQQGDIFPLIWAFNNVQKNIYAEALTDGQAQVIAKKKFLDYIHNNQAAALEMITIFSKVLSTYVDRVNNLEYDNVRDKVLNRLLFFSKRFSSGQGKKRSINLPITHKLIAESINVSRENVTRELKILEKKNILAFNKRQIIINDINKLLDE